MCLSSLQGSLKNKKSQICNRSPLIILAVKQMRNQKKKKIVSSTHWLNQAKQSWQDSILVATHLGSQTRKSSPTCSILFWSKPVFKDWQSRIASSAARPRHRFYPTCFSQASSIPSRILICANRATSLRMRRFHYSAKSLRPPQNLHKLEYKSKLARERSRSICNWPLMVRLVTSRSWTRTQKMSFMKLRHREQTR